jgi:hypothetical protein
MVTLQQALKEGTEHRNAVAQQEDEAADLRRKNNELLVALAEANKKLEANDQAADSALAKARAAGAGAGTGAGAGREKEKEKEKKKEEDHSVLARARGAGAEPGTGGEKEKEKDNGVLLDLQQMLAWQEREKKELQEILDLLHGKELQKGGEGEDVEDEGDEYGGGRTRSPVERSFQEPSVEWEAGGSAYLGLRSGSRSGASSGFLTPQDEKELDAEIAAAQTENRRLRDTLASLEEEAVKDKDRLQASLERQQQQQQQQALVEGGSGSGSDSDSGTEGGNALHSSPTYSWKEKEMVVDEEEEEGGG